MITSASTKIRSSDDGIRQPKPPLDADEWLVDYRRGLEAKIQSRKPPEVIPNGLIALRLCLKNKAPNRPVLWRKLAARSHRPADVHPIRQAQCDRYISRYLNKAKKGPLRIKGWPDVSS